MRMSVPNMGQRPTSVCAILISLSQVSAGSAHTHYRNREAKITPDFTFIYTGGLKWALVQNSCCTSGQPLQSNHSCYYYYAVGCACVHACMCVCSSVFLQGQLCSHLSFTIASEKAQVAQQDGFLCSGPAGMHCHL